jgi:hypothetical protein
MPSVKCQDCGYIGARIKGREEPIEVVDRLRLHGQFSRDETHEVICYANSPQFPIDHITSDAEFVATISREIACQKFITLIPGKSPKEHEGVTILEQVREENRKAQECADLKVQDREKKEDARHWRAFSLSLAALIVSVAIGIANFVFTLLKHSG